MPRTEAEIIATVVTLRLIAADKKRFNLEARLTAQRTLRNIGESW